MTIYAIGATGCFRHEAIDLTKLIYFGARVPPAPPPPWQCTLTRRACEAWIEIYMKKETCGFCYFYQNR